MLEMIGMGKPHHGLYLLQQSIDCNISTFIPSILQNLYSVITPAVNTASHVVSKSFL